MKTLLKKYDHLIFAVSGLLFAFILSRVPLIVDDEVRHAMLAGSSSLGDILDYALSFYTGATANDSRILIIIPAVFFAAGPKIIWAAFMGLDLYLLFFSLKILFPCSNRLTCALAICACVMLYSFSILSSAGWITTMSAYFAPICLALVSFIPFKLLADKQSLKPYMYALFIPAIIYSANSEQILIPEFICAFFIMLYLKKRDGRYALYPVIMMILCIASAVFTFMTPANSERMNEEAALFPEFMRFNILNKAELGLESACYLLTESGRPFYIFCCILIAMMIFRKYKSAFVRILSVLLILSAAAGLLIYIPSLPHYSPVPPCGLFFPPNYGFRVFAKYMLLTGSATLFFFGLLIALDDGFDRIICTGLFAGGFLSRMIIGFVPSIYASGERTAAVMDFAVIVACVCLASEYYEGSSDKKKTGTILIPVFLFMIVAGFISLFNAVS